MHRQMDRCGSAGVSRRPAVKAMTAVRVPTESNVLAKRVEAIFRSAVRKRTARITATDDARRRRTPFHTSLPLLAKEVHPAPMGMLDPDQPRSRDEDEGETFVVSRAPGSTPKAKGMSCGVEHYPKPGSIAIR